MRAKRETTLLIHIDPAAPIPLYQQIYRQFRDAISEGRLATGVRLASIRSLAFDLGVSHTTVEQAYLQLATEGFVEGIPRSGYVVAHIDTEYMALDRHVDVGLVESTLVDRSRDAFFAENRAGAQVPFDFSYANLQPDAFPANEWRRILSDVLYRFDCPELSRYEYTDEPSSLTSALARHLARTRGVRCVPEQVFVQAGTDGALSTVLQLFDRERDVLGMEEPGYATVHEVARRQGFRMTPLPSDQGSEVFLSALDRAKPRIVFTTPSHQFPTGSLLSLDVRTRLLRWAEANDAFIVEDDSCNEFRYGTAPIPSLQSLDAFGRVVYLNNVSKTLAPGLRVAYVVLPPYLLRRYWELFNYAHPPVSWLTCEVLARFMEGGHWDAHVRRVLKSNRRNRDELLRHLGAELGETVRVSGTDAGMHFYVAVRNGMTQRELLESALAEGAKVYGTSRMWFSRPAPEENVMIGFSAISHDRIADGVAALRRAWRG
ncbi:PLP-dependent aminotransferase family protein [Eggerthellaceae bacterium zg-1084]|uniref:MocR-like pyridoxine biosynthesis transcription factor PdxR n=1 Tax=Berryella wangjianweii TaxID=2734634 RepID=UPI0015563FBE|nr:PLP-dependent aminotransferase family protein [Berryella wangjianweii]NPD31429.1 PLP-dependent aminotransferase family protein [Berryella wangjianweii]